MGTFKTALSQLGFLTLVGLGAIILIGPAVAVLSIAISLVVALLSVVVALASVLLPFAVIGLLVWLPFQLFQKARFDRQQVNQWGSAVQRNVIAPSARGCAVAWRRTAQLSASAWDKCTGLGWAVGGVLLETLSGAAVLGMLAGLVATTMPKKYMDEYIVVGMLLGSLLGFLIGLANYRPARRGLCEDAPCES